MATKKQKRAQALAKREAFLEEEREIGRKAIEVARHKREIEERQMWERRHEKHHKFESECPMCTAIKNRQAVEKLASAQGKPAKTKLDIDSLLAESPAIEDQAAVEKAKVSV